MSLLEHTPDLLRTTTSAGWDEARAAWNLAVDQRPAGVVLAGGPEDVAEAFAIAGSHGWRVAAQSTGHNPGPLGDLGRTLLVKTSPMREVTIDPVRRLARAGGGACWGDVVTAAAEHGLAPLAGSSPDVGVAGYTLGGGVSWLGRRHGLASNSVVSLDVVTPDSQSRTVDPDHDADLYWALRGGGGSFGVVTGLEFTLFPVPVVYAGQLLWPLDRAAEVFRAWRDWARGLDRTTSTCVRLLRLPDIPDVPAPLRNGKFVVVEIAHLGSASSGTEVAAPMRSLGPGMDLVTETGPEALVTLHMDPPHPVPGAGTGAFVDDLPDTAIDALLAKAGPDVDSHLLSVEVRLLGGAFAEAPADAGAVAATAAGYLMYAVGMAPPPVTEAVRQEAHAALAAVRRWHSPYGCTNFAEDPTPAHTLWPAETLSRLRQLAVRYDPDGVMHANHPLF